MENERLAKLEEKVDVILNNHLAHIQTSMAAMDTNMSWLLRFFWIIATASIGSIIAQIVTLIR